MMESERERAKFDGKLREDGSRKISEKDRCAQAHVPYGAAITCSFTESAKVKQRAKSRCLSISLICNHHHHHHDARDFVATAGDRQLCEVLAKDVDPPLGGAKRAVRNLGALLAGGRHASLLSGLFYLFLGAYPVNPFSLEKVSDMSHTRITPYLDCLSTWMTLPCMHRASQPVSSDYWTM
ncbi:hypothetical protein BDZ89DRAFT_812997 [Hymenopellis radicata]|nr:hypothetical protein BDZ89DRAFT_812997 [Hymenopellis radicata]